MKKAFIIFSIIILTFMNKALAAPADSRLEGKILLQVQQNGEAWYIYDGLRYYMKDGDIAYQMMRNFGLGITDSDLSQIPLVEDTTDMKDSSSICNYNSLANRVKGKILLQVQQNGEAWYVDTEKCSRIYMKDGAAAYEIMRYLSLGITDSDLAKIDIGDDTGLTVVSSNVVVDTNQSKCFDDSSQINCPGMGEIFYGQDAQYSSTEPSYTDNGDGTVTDNNTGLMWLQDAGDKVYYYEGINSVNNFSYAGYDDWRVPSIKELYSLMDFSGKDIDPTTADTSNSNPFIDNEVFVFEYGDMSAGDRAIDSQWITSNIYVSKVMNNQECFFGVNFADGRIKCYPTESSNHNNGYFMRLVRGGNNYGKNNFVENSNGTISDNSSDLMWQQNDSAYSMDWDNALSYCEDLSLAGYNDWRLPNAKELQYIVDYTRSPDISDSPALDPIFKSTSITNEAGVKDYPFYWTGTTHENQSGGSHAVYISFGRALGYMNGSWMDVHGAGAQRSDPKVGSSADYPTGHGPQGDAIRIKNYARCVRGGQLNMSDGEEYNSSNESQNQPNNNLPAPPAEAINACANKNSGNSCAFGPVQGTCAYINSQLACKP